MSRTASAPWPRATNSCTGSTTKSLHSTGSVDRVGHVGQVAERPAEAVGSVSTLIAAAPPSW